MIKKDIIIIVVVIILGLSLGFFLNQKTTQIPSEVNQSEKQVEQSLSPTTTKKVTTETYPSINSPYTKKVKEILSDRIIISDETKEKEVVILKNDPRVKVTFFKKDNDNLIEANIDEIKVGQYLTVVTRGVALIDVIIE